MFVEGRYDQAVAALDRAIRYGADAAEDHLLLGDAQRLRGNPHSAAIAYRAAIRRDPGLALTLRTVTFNDAQSALSVMTCVRDTSLLAFVNEVIAARTDKPTVSAALTLIR